MLSHVVYYNTYELHFLSQYGLTPAGVFGQNMILVAIISILKIKIDIVLHQILINISCTFKWGNILSKNFKCINRAIVIYYIAERSW